MRRSLWGALLLPWLLLFCHSDSLAFTVVNPRLLPPGVPDPGGARSLQTQAYVVNTDSAASLNATTFADSTHGLNINIGSHTGEYGKPGAINSTTGLLSSPINCSGFADFTLAFSDSGTGRLTVAWVALDPGDMTTPLDTILLGATTTINQITRVSLNGSIVLLTPVRLSVGKLWFRAASGTSCLEKLGPMVLTTVSAGLTSLQSSYRSVVLPIYTIRTDDVGGLGPLQSYCLSTHMDWTDNSEAFGFESSTTGAAGQNASQYSWAAYISLPQGSEDFWSISGGRTGWGRTWIYDCMILQAEASVAACNATANYKFGIGMGVESACVAAYPTSPTVPLVLLYARLDTLQWELFVAKGDATAGTKIVLTGVDAPTVTANPNTSFRLRLIYDTPHGVIAALVNGKVGAMLTDATYFPSSTETDNLAFAMFNQSGTNTNAAMNTRWKTPTATLIFDDK